MNICERIPTTTENRTGSVCGSWQKGPVTSLVPPHFGRDCMDSRTRPRDLAAIRVHP